MEPREWVYLAVSSGLGVIMWFLKRTITVNETNIENMQREITEIKLNYLRQSDFKDFKAELRAQFDELKDMIKDLKH